MTTDTVSFEDLFFLSNKASDGPTTPRHTCTRTHGDICTYATFCFQSHIHTNTLRTSSWPPSLVWAKQVLSFFNVSSSIDPLLKLLPWVGIGQIQSHTGQFITKPQTLSLTVRKGGGMRRRALIQREVKEKERWRIMGNVDKEKQTVVEKWEGIYFSHTSRLTNDY